MPTLPAIPEARLNNRSAILSQRWGKLFAVRTSVLASTLIFVAPLVANILGNNIDQTSVRTAPSGAQIVTGNRRVGTA